VIVFDIPIAPVRWCALEAALSRSPAREESPAAAEEGRILPRRQLSLRN
jgi:hypothetical protein